MQFTLESTPSEIAEKGEALVKAIQEELAPLRPDLAKALGDAMERGKNPDVAVSPYPALRELEEESHRRYVDQVERMVDDIIAVLEEKQLTKAEQEAKSRAISRLVHEGVGTAEALERLSIPELLQKAALL